MFKASVIVCTYNRCESLRDTLSSLVHQCADEGLDCDIIVVDNNSTDGTKTVVEEVAGKSGKPVRYLFEPLQGKSHALNSGIRAACGDFIAFCDDDVIADSNWIQELYKAFVTFNADVVGGPVKPLWSSKPPKWLEDPARQFGPLAVLDRGERPIIAGEAERKAGNFLFGSNMAIRRSVFNEVGLFRTDLGPAGARKGGSEDSEMVKCLLEVNKRMVYIPTAFVIHKIPPERMTLAYLRKWNFWMARSNARLSTFQKVTPSALLLDCMKSACAALSYYAVGKHTNAVGAEINFWWRLGTLVELLTKVKIKQGDLCQ